MPSRPPRSPLPWLACALLLSGAGSLALEQVWARRLELVFGASTLAITTVLCAYMLGLGLGGWIGGQIVARLRDGVRAYAAAELGVGVVALALPHALDSFATIDRLLASWSNGSAALLRFLIALVALLPMTLLMGLTLPIVITAVRRRQPRASDPAGLLYGINTLGAVLGVALVTYLLLPHWGLNAASRSGALLMIGAGTLALVAVGRNEKPITLPPARVDRDVATPVRWPILYALVGFLALAWEVAWTRTLTLTLGSSLYAFATILMSYLGGIALGALLGRRWLRGTADAAARFHQLLIALSATSLVTFLALVRLPDLSLALIPLVGVSRWPLTLSTLCLALLALLPPTLILGALFPIVVRAAAPDPADEGRIVGRLYLGNTVGATFGALTAACWLIPQLGLARTITWLALVPCAIGAWQTRRYLIPLLLAGGALLVPQLWNAELLTRGVFYRPSSYVDFGLPLRDYEGIAPPHLLFYRDGLSSTVSVHANHEGRDLRINGKPDASYDDMPTQSLIAHIPLLLTPQAQRVAVIGLASGVTAGTANLYGPQRLDVIDLEPAMATASEFFDELNYKPLAAPPTRLIIDDGRHWLATHPGQYDAILSEPSNPVLAGCASLFTREFFRTAHAALTPGGRLLQWMQLYGMDDQAVASVLAALTGEFHYVYGFAYRADWDDLLLLASDSPLTLDDFPSIAALPTAVRTDLRRIQLVDDADLIALLRLMPDDLQDWAARAQTVNTDDSMAVELRTPWMMRRSSTDLHALIDKRPAGVAELRGRGGRAASAAQLAAWAWSNLQARGDLHQAVALLAASRARGESPRQGALDALLGDLRGAERAATEPLAQRALGAAMDDPLVLSACARRLMRRGAHEEALALAERAVQLDADDPRHRYLRMQLLARLGRTAEAETDAAALLSDPLTRFDSSIWLESGTIALRQQRSAVAIERLERFTRRMPRSAAGWKALEEAYRSAGRTEDAARAARNQQAAQSNARTLQQRNERWRTLTQESATATER